MNARIVRILSKDYTLLLEDGTRVTAVAMGKLRKNESPVVGDLVEAEVLHGRFRQLSGNGRHSGSGPDHKDIGRTADKQLPALAGCLFGVLHN